MVEPAENLGSGAREEVGEPVEPQLEETELQLMEEMVELGEADPPLLRALSYWSRDSVLAINGPSTAIPVVTELGRYLSTNQADKALENLQCGRSNKQHYQCSRLLCSSNLFKI